jgi:RHS repeat-associated protein
MGGVLRTDGTLADNQYYYRDGQGSVSAVSDNSGNVLEAYEYTAQGWFQIADGSGTVLTATGIGNDLMYANYRYDAETGNYFCNARYYNPKLGRFISRDPLSGAEFSQGTNLYAYCGNDGVNGSDPSGMSGHWEGGGADTWGAFSYWVADTPPATPTQGGPNSLHNPAQIVAGAGLIANGMEASGAKIGSNGRLYLNAMAQGNGSYRIAANLGKMGKALGPAGALIGTGFDIAQGLQGTESPTMVGINVYMAGIGIFGGPPGEIAAGVFFTGEFAYNMFND